MVQPLLKWPGGKRWLLKTGILKFPSSYESYFEPFLGGGSVFFHLQPRKGTISDKNAELINLYENIREFPQRMETEIQRHQELHDRKHYYDVRSVEPTCKFERAVRFLYLNRACWNGLYRVNRKGQFNVPIGTKQKILFENDDFSKIADILKNVQLQCADFESVIDKAESNDFIFVDPPYATKNSVNGFVQYNDEMFTWGDQERLYSSIERAADRGCSIIVTNADHECVKNLYRLAKYHQTRRSCVLAGLGYKRGVVSEAIFTFNL